MKYIKFILLFVFCNTIAQTIIKDTVYITKSSMSHLVFTDKPVHTDFGSGFIASQSDGVPFVKKVNDSWLVIIKAKKKFKTPTNISVVTDSNVYYDITCLYSDSQKDNFRTFDFGNPAKQAYVADKSIDEVIVSEDEKDIEIKSALKKDELVEKKYNKFYNDTVRFKGIAKELYSSNKGKAKRISNKNSKVSLSLLGTFAKKDKIYLKVRVYNGGTLPYDMEKWYFYYTHKGSYNPETSSENNVDSIFEYNEIYQSVLPHSSVIKVFVFNDFSISKKQNFHILLTEQNGERDIPLYFNSSYINEAQTLNNKKIKR